MSGELQFDGYGAYLPAGGGAKFYPDLTKGGRERITIDGTGANPLAHGAPPTTPRGGIRYGDASAPPLPRREVTELRALADHLEPGLAGYLRRLLADDSDAHRYGEMRGRVERADGLVGELRRTVETRTRVLDEWIARAKRAEARADQAEARARAAEERA